MTALTYTCLDLRMKGKMKLCKETMNFFALKSSHVFVVVQMVTIFQNSPAIIPDGIRHVVHVLLGGTALA